MATKPTSPPGAPLPVGPGPPHHIPTPSPRCSRRDPCDTTDAAGALIEPCCPYQPAPTPAGGRPGDPPGRQIVDAIGYLVHNGGVWPARPIGFPPWPTEKRPPACANAAGGPIWCQRPQ
jgi:transposase